MSQDAPMSDVTIVDLPQTSRYELSVDGQRAGILTYRLTDGLIVLTHIVIDEAHGGQGLGGRLAQYALDDARARGLRVEPRCGYIRGWLARHPDYADLVA